MILTSRHSAYRIRFVTLVLYAFTGHIIIPRYDRV